MNRLARTTSSVALCSLTLVSLAIASCAPDPRADMQHGQTAHEVTVNAPALTQPPAAEAVTEGGSGTRHSARYAISNSGVTPPHLSRSVVANRGVFAALGAPGDGRGATRAMSPFGGLEEEPAPRDSAGAHGARPRGRAAEGDIDAEQVPTSNLLTAAAVGDNDRRGNYTEFLSRHDEERDALDLDMTRRVRFRVVDSRGRSVNDASLDVSATQETVARGRSHADGGWDWFPSLRHGGIEGPLTVRAHAGSAEATASFTLPARGDVADTITVHLPSEIDSQPRVLDLGFLIDATGSMGDELRYVNREIVHIVDRIGTTAPGVRIRVGAVFYRDRTDDERIARIQFTTDAHSFASDMQRVIAMGGGDYPEDMNAGLEAAFDQLSWSDGNADRVLVVIADAPPQHYADEQFTWHQAISAASQRGMRIVPVAASGADRTVEYLFRAMGAATSTPYVYLTDDSGVGAPHLAADTDHVTVEHFGDLLTRLVISDLQGAGMHEPGAQS